jgi:hypothetical protein
VLQEFMRYLCADKIEKSKNSLILLSLHNHSSPSSISLIKYYKLVYYFRKTFWKKIQRSLNNRSLFLTLNFIFGKFFPKIILINFVAVHGNLPGNTSGAPTAPWGV